MNRKEQIKNIYNAPPEINNKSATTTSNIDPIRDHVPAGPVRSMGLALDRMEEESRLLKEALTAGLSIVDLETALIDVSIVPDRLAEPVDSSFELLKQSIKERGQEIPILVRPHPTHERRYQVAYGHRRLRAASELGRKVKAIVRSLSDPELIVAQGIENSQRKDLSFIEKALFAMRLEDRAFDRSIIFDALATDKTELSKMISVARGIPESIICAIGPAPKTGRRRWLAMANTLRDPIAHDAAVNAAKDPRLAKVESDTRFVRILAATATTPNPKTVKNWKKLADSISQSEKALNFTFDPSDEPQFAEFVASKLDDLYATFLAEAKTPTE